MNRGSRSTRRRGDERGTGTVLTLGVLVVIMVLFVTGATLSRYLLASHRARSAADLAALAGAVAYQSGQAAPVRSACAAAAASVRANQAEVVDCEVVGDATDFVVTVTTSVEVGRAPLPGLPAAVPGRAHAGPATDFRRAG